MSGKATHTLNIWIEKLNSQTTVSKLRFFQHINTVAAVDACGGLCPNLALDGRGYRWYADEQESIIDLKD